MGPMENLIAHYARLRYEDLSAEAVEAARGLVIDALGCALAGSSAPLNPEIVERHARWGGAPEASVLVFGHRLPAPLAAWLNAAMIHANDFDDTEDETQNHVLVTLLPAVLAAGESRERPLPGREVLTALVGAAEISLRLNRCVRDHIHSGWLPTTVFGSIGAAAAAAKILGLGAEGIADAAGLGYAQSHGNRQALLDGTVAKRLQPAFSARAGVQAAVLAELGATGPRRIVEGANGILQLFGGGRGRPEALAEGLGERFEICRVGIKPYPCCRCAHPTISAALEARAALGRFGPGDVESVEVWITPISHSMIGQPFAIRQNPQVDAQFSAQWTAAFSLLNGTPGPAHFTPEAVTNGSEVRDLAGRVRVHMWEEGSLLLVPARVSVRLRDGRAAEVTHDRTKGAPEWPLTPEERREKFFACARCAALPLEEEAAAEAYALLERIEEADDVRPAIARLAAAAARVG